MLQSCLHLLLGGGEAVETIDGCTTETIVLTFVAEDHCHCLLVCAYFPSGWGYFV